jgi:signal transduction histidine kinase/DNA-binding NarL/FixJ family response regulator
MERLVGASEDGFGEFGSLKRELFSRFIVVLFVTQMTLLLLGGAFAFGTIQSQQREQLRDKATKVAELFALLARYGDVRYARFAVIAAGETDGLVAFHVLDSDGRELQAENPASPARIPASDVDISRSVLSSLEKDGTQVRIIRESAKGASRNFVHLVRTPDGAAYLLASSLIGSGRQWMKAGAVVLCGLIVSSVVATFFAARRLRRVVRALEAYAKQVRRLDADRRSSAVAPFVELLPLQQAISELVQSLREQMRMAAIASMTQILAHDVRKPFSILRIALGMLQSADDMDKVRRVLRRAVPDAEKALASVNGLISDVMEVGSTSTSLIQEPIAPESLIESTVFDLFRIYPHSNIAIDYDFQHTSMVSVHVNKIARVFSNIVGNALQAIDFRGRIWFKTRECADMVEFCLGNADSSIEPEDRPKLFEAFFTGGKKGGTGLGLAIAHKIVTAHGGRILCESARTPEHPRGFVEFRFTLPVAKGVASAWAMELPTHSSQVTRDLARETAGDESTSDGELKLIDAIVEASGALGRSVRILVIDDEAIYFRALNDQIQSSNALKSVCVIEQATKSSEVLALEPAGYDLIIADLDLGCESRDGFEVVGDLRRRGVRGLVCVHSNRIVAEDHRRALDSGGDAFLPKPMPRVHLLKLILQAAQRAGFGSLRIPKSTMDDFSSGGFRGRTKFRAANEINNGSKKVIVVEDDIFLQEAWRQALVGSVVLTYARPSDLLVDIENGVVQAANIDVVVTDFHFENEPAITGPMLARRLAAEGFGRVVAATDAVIGSEDRVLFAEVIAKDEIAVGLDIARVVG